MSNRKLVAHFAVAIAAFVTVAFAQKKPTPARQKVVVVGASLSAGFADPTSKGPDGEVNRTYKLDVAFKKAWPRSVARLYNFGDMMMFSDPEARGKKQIESAKRTKPDLLLGIDFLTWFGYGGTHGRVKKNEVDPVRMKQLEKGLALLDGLKCPIVAGEFPDMHGASTHMLPMSMIPNVATINALNKRLREWAKTRKHIFVFPLARFVQEAVSKKQIYPWGNAQQVTLPKRFLLQSDRLHATKIGTLVVVLRVVEALPGILSATHPLLGPKVTFKGLVEAAKLEDALPEPVALKVRKLPVPRAAPDRRLPVAEQLAPGRKRPQPLEDVLHHRSVGRQK